MDIQFAYNLERLLYYTSDNTHTVEQIMRAVDDQFNFKPNATGEQISFILVFCHRFLFLFLFFVEWCVNFISVILDNGLL